MNKLLNKTIATLIHIALFLVLLIVTDKLLRLFNGYNLECNTCNLIYFIGNSVIYLYLYSFLNKIINKIKL